jgi:hypothetical protein
MRIYLAQFITPISKINEMDYNYMETELIMNAVGVLDPLEELESTDPQFFKRMY